MTTFLTALMWGLGVTLGVTLGLLPFIILKEATDRILGKDAFLNNQEDFRKRIIQANEDTVVALTRRNDLTLETIGAQLRIAEALEGAQLPDVVTTSELWEEFTVNLAGCPEAPPLCGLCGNTGKIVINGLQTPAGLEVQSINQPCICPAGRALT